MTTLIDAFYQAVDAHPNRPAVLADGQQYSYAQLKADAQSVAFGLMSAGVKPENRVGLSLGRSYELVLAQLGVLMAGASILPLDGKAPPARNAAILSAAKVRHWIGVTPAEFPASFCDIAALRQQGAQADLPALSAQTPAIIYHTSGTTGTPKGVLVTHQGILRMARSPDYVPISPNDRMLNLSNPAFDASNFELWGALLNGACLCVIGADEDPAEAMLATQPTVGFITTSLFQILLAQSPESFTSFHSVLFGGESSNPEILREYMAQHADAPRFIHVYGPTETTTFALAYAIPDGFFKAAPTAIPIGKPIRKTGLELLVKGTRQAAIGEIGEIYLSGAGLALGYIDAPGLTQASFAPIEGLGDALFYKTGDLGRLDAAGNITFLGRADRQVKIRGFRVELAEIEALITPIKGVTQAAVLVQRSQQNTQDIYAFVSGTARAETIRAELAKSLPAYAVPHSIQIVKMLPVNANGKLDHSALFSQIKHAEPMPTTLPKAIWQTVVNVLGHANIDDQKSFIALGGDSLKATVLRHSLLTQHKLRVRDADLLANRALGDVIKNAQATTDMFKAENKPRYPATVEQTGLWLQQTAAPHSTAYSVPLTLQLGGEVNVKALAQALAHLVQRHGALRSCFSEQNGELTVEERPFAGFELAQGRVEGFFEKPFALNGEPLLRACLDGQSLLLNFHHIVVDGHSLNLFFAELNSAYSAYCEGISPDLPRIGANYGAYAGWQKKQRTSQEYQENLQALAARLSDPIIDYGPPVAGTRGARLTRRLTARQLQRLQSFCEAQNKTLFSQLYSSFAQAYAPSKNAVQIGVPVGNRPDGRVQNTLGMFVNTTVYRGGAPTPDLNEVAYTDLLAQLRLKGQNGAPFEAMFVLENTHFQSVTLGDLTVEVQEPKAFEPRFPFTLFAVPEADGLRLSYDYDTAIFSAYDVAQVANRMEVVLDELSEISNAPTLLEALENAPETALAATFKEIRLTYGELRTQSDGLARVLAAKGLGAGDLIGIMMPRSEKMLVALLAVLKSGAAYVPLDAESPRARIAGLLEDAGVRLVLSDASVDLPVRSLPLTQWSQQKQADVPESPKERAYVMFTSGSTGAPKGVEISHGNLNAYLRHAGGYFRGPTLGAVASSPFTFDATITAMLGPIMVAKTAHILPQDQQEIPELAKIMQSERPFVFKITPAHIAALFGYLEGESLAPHWFIIGGEALKTAVLQRFATHFPNATFVNEYGPTEATVGCCVAVYSAAEVSQLQGATVPIGHPIEGAALSIKADTGELVIKGESVATGYLGQPSRTAERFSDDGYHTGDLATRLPGGSLRYDGRVDDQINLNGYRIEPAEIEAALESAQGVESAVVTTQNGAMGEAQLVAHCKGAGLSASEIRSHIAALLPTYMVPQHIEIILDIPLTPNGKTDKASLAPSSGPEAQILAAFEAVLGYPIMPEQHFFEAGAGSLVLMKVHANLCRETGVDLQLVDFFQHPTAQQLAVYLAKDLPAEPVQAAKAEANDDVAIIGMAVSVSTAPTLADFADLVFGSSSGLTPPEKPGSGRVPVASILDNPLGFDPDYFGISHKEARLMDPQQRHLLMGAVQALENAGIRPEQGRIGCLMSSSENTYHLQQVSASEDFYADRAPLAMQNEKDFLASRIAYHLGLTGPAFTVQSACSSSLLGVHQACTLLQQGEAESMIVGGVAIDQMTFDGYTYREGGILSKSGACTPFSDKADGTVPGNGCGVVVLKPLAKAQADGNRIYAVIKGSATNNDGKNKVGFTAPSVEGQAGVIRSALAKAGLGPADISCLEAHGTATNLGDPIEVRALKQIFDEEARIALSSVKSQIGHLGAGAGVAGLIRTALAVFLGKIPPNHGFSNPNPALALENSPFYIPTAACQWPVGPRHAGVSSFGLGGTNVHVVLSHAPVCQATPSARPACLVLSADTEAALKVQIAEMSTYLASFNGDFQALAQHSQTAQRAMPWRVAVIASTPSEALILLQAARPQLTAHTPAALTIPAPAPEIAQAFLAGQDILGAPAPAAPWDMPPRPFALTPFNVEPKNKRPPFENWFSQPGWARLERAKANGFQPDMVWDGQKIAPSGPSLHIWFRVGAQPLADALAELGALMAALGPRSAHVVVLTSDACAVGATPASRPEHAALGAALRVLALEHPALQLTHLDLPEGFDPTGLSTINLPTGASLALRGGMLWQARFDLVTLETPTFSLQKGGVYVVTGGTGGIGQYLEKMIVSAGATALIVARNAPDPQLSYDIADSVEVAKLAEHIANTHGRISGVFHAAGAAGGGVLQHLSARKIKQNMRAKLEGFQQVATHLAPLADDFVLSLSSMSALMGVRGQADYAAANAAVDALGLAALNGPAMMSVNLPTWRETGMAEGQDLSGLEGYALSPREGVRAIKHALALGLPQVAVSPLPVEQVACLMAPKSPKDETVRAIFCAALGLESCDADASFNDLGGDSLASLDVLDGLNAAFGLNWRAADLGADFSIRALEARLKTPAAPMAPADLVLVHPIGGDIGCYRALQSALGGLNVGLIEDPFIADSTSEPMSIEARAAAYIAQLPQGNFWLGGWSFGGVVAFEMARQLAQAGRAPRGLVMIDPPAAMRCAMPDKQALEQTFRAEIIAQTGQDLGQDHPHFRRIVEACTRNTQALAQYQPKGNVTCPTQLFMAGQRCKVEQSWQALTPASITRLEADHYSILRPPALHVLAQQLLGLSQPEKEEAHV